MSSGRLVAVRYRRLGSSGLRLSEVGLGTWLTAGTGVDEATMRAIVSRALDVGVNFFDTADVYAGGEAERVLGRALANVPRGRFVLATKVYFPTGDSPNERGLSRKHLTESIGDSLERLGVRTVDLFQCHRFDREVPLEETVATMSDLVRRGLIHHWGTSEWTSVEIARACAIAERHGLERPSSNQAMYNAIQRRVEFDVLDTCASFGVGLLAYSPLAQGVLSGKYLPGQEYPSGSRASDPDAGTLLRSRLDDDVLRRVESLGRALEGRRLTDVAIAFCLREPAVTSVLTGASNPEQIASNAAAVEAPLGTDTLSTIDSLLGSAPIDQYLGRPAARAPR